MAESGMKLGNAQGGSLNKSTSGNSVNNSYGNSGISVERVGSTSSYDPSSFVANKSTKKNLEQEIKSEHSVGDVLSKQGVYSSIADDPPFYGKVYDSLGVDWIKNPGYHGNFVKNIPLYGVSESRDSVVNFVYPEGTFKFNNFIKGENGVDTVKHYFNRGTVDDFADTSKIDAISILYGKGDGSVIDSLKVYLPLQKK